MKVLIIDDTQYKIQSLESVLRECENVQEIFVARSFHSGVQMIEDLKPNLILLDMTLPTSERPDGDVEGRMRLYGGREILAEMDDLDLRSRVIIVTQYDHFGKPPDAIDLAALIARLKKRFPKLLVGGVYYSSVNSSWRLELKQLIDEAGSSLDLFYENPSG